MVEQRNEKMVLYKAVLTLNRQRWGWCYKPHKSKVKGANKANLLKIMVRTIGCTLSISQECDIAATPDQQPKSKTLLGMSKGLAWGSCWWSLSAKVDRQLDSIIKEKHAADATRTRRRSQLAYTLTRRANLAEQMEAPCKMHERIRLRAHVLASPRRLTWGGATWGSTDSQRRPTLDGIPSRYTSTWRAPTPPDHLPYGEMAGNRPLKV